MSNEQHLIKLGHSPDPDDAFMWWPLLDEPRIDTGRFRFESVALDIEALNHRSEQADLEVTAMSCAQYPYVADRYAITACGSSMGDDYGPRLVAMSPTSPSDLAKADPLIAIPGERTSAFGALNLALGRGSFRYKTIPFDRIIESVVDGTCDAGLVIHEGQLTFQDSGLHLILDLGRWWKQQEGLLLPLGLNTIRRDLDELYGPGSIQQITSLLSASVCYALEHREESIQYALQFARGLPFEQADRFIEMYVNCWTLDFGPDGKQAITRFLNALHENGLVPAPGSLEPIPG